MSCPLSAKYDIISKIRLRELMHIYLMKNLAKLFNPNRILMQRSLSLFFTKVTPQQEGEQQQ